MMIAGVLSKVSFSISNFPSIIPYPSVSMEEEYWIAYSWLMFQVEYYSSSLIRGEPYHLRKFGE